MEVLGHTCEGLEVFHAAVSYACVPTILEDGTIRSCDEENEVPIVYCPFCGEKLNERT